MELIPLPLIVFVVQILKRFGLPKEYIQLVVFGLAIAASFLFYWDKNVYQQAIGVLTYALGAIGSYEVAKELIEPKKEETIQEP